MTLFALLLQINTSTLNYVLAYFVSVQSGVSYHQETFQWMFTHIAVVRDLVAMQYKEYQEVLHLCHYMQEI